MTQFYRGVFLGECGPPSPRTSAFLSPQNNLPNIRHLYYHMRKQNTCGVFFPTEQDDHCTHARILSFFVCFFVLLLIPALSSISKQDLGGIDTAGIDPGHHSVHKPQGTDRPT